MKKSKVIFPLLATFLLVFILSSCNNTSEKDGKVKIDIEKADGTKSTYESDVPADMDQAADQIKDVLKNLQEENVEIVNFRDLQGLLDEKMAGMNRVSKEGQTSGAMGIKVSIAEAKYEDPSSGKKIKVEIVDTGGLGMATMAAAAWASAEIDKEDNNGYERTTKFEGYPAYEKLNKNSGDAQISLMVDKRFIVNVSGQTGDINPLTKLVKAIGLGKLEKMGK